MVDLHSHFLPGIDDGARSLEESVRMLEVAAAAGTTDLVATPHFNLDYQFDPGIIRAKLAEVAAASRTSIRLHYGCDFHFYYENIQKALADPQRFTLAQRCYLLVEFSDLLIPSNSTDVFRTLLDRGIVPVITHPERNYLLQARLPLLKAWASEGVLLQVTGQSFLGRFGASARKFSDELMRAGLVHIVASDAHDPEDRPPRLDHAHRYVAEKFGREWAHAVCVLNPAAALAGEPLPEQPAPVRRKRWFLLWR